MALTLLNPSILRTRSNTRSAIALRSPVRKAHEAPLLGEGYFQTDRALVSSLRSAPTRRLTPLISLGSAPASTVFHSTSQASRILPAADSDFSQIILRTLN